VRRYFSSAALLLLTPFAAISAENEYWSYAYRNIEVTAAGSSTYAVNLARYCVRLDGLLTRILGIKSSERPPVRLYALPPSQVRQFLGDGERVSFRIAPGGDTILTSNAAEFNSDYWGAYFGYTGALLASVGQLGGPDWYKAGLPLVFAGTKYHLNRAQLGTVQYGYALTLGQAGALIPMRTFLSLKRATIDNNAATLKIYDAESWGLAHEVFVEGWHRAEFAKYLALMRQGGQEPEAFAASFNMTYEQLDKELAYALRQRAFAYTMDSPDSGDAGETARRLNAEEVKARLDLLATQYPTRANKPH
jgi:hypothetical protein